MHPTMWRIISSIKRYRFGSTVFKIVQWFRKILKLDVMQVEVPTVCESSQMKQNIIDAMSIFLERTIKVK